MQNSAPLVPFGLAIILIVGLAIAVPYLRRKTELLTAWNTLLLGIITFTGLGSIEVKYVPEFSWAHLNWFQPTVKEINWYMAATAAFIATLLVAYYYNTPAKKFAQRRLQKWPEFSAPVTFFVLGYCFVVVIMSMVFQNVTFIGPLTFNLAAVGVPAACVFSFALWQRNRLNVLWLVLFLVVLASTGLYAMVISGGRRLLLSLFLGPVLCLYWSTVRHWKPSKAIIATGLAAVFILGISAVYSKIRFYNLPSREQRTFGGVIEQIRGLRQRGDYFSEYFRNQLDYLAQSNGHFALLTARYVNQRALKPEPLNTLKFLVAYPIPHNVWEDKPEVIGLTITRDVAHVGTNWGLGIAGQGAFEGGIPALMLYAVLLAFFMRFLDEPLQMQPTNPFLIYIHAAALPHVASIPRGDMGIMVKEAIQCVIFAVLLGIACRLIFGTQKRGVPVNQVPLRYGFPPGQRLVHVPRPRS
jgi:hypothetical protein